MKYAGDKKVVLCVRFEPCVYEKLQKMADEQNKKKSEIIREIINQAISV